MTASSTTGSSASCSSSINSLDVISCSGWITWTGTSVACSSWGCLMMTAAAAGSFFRSAFLGLDPVSTSLASSNSSSSSSESFSSSSILSFLSSNSSF